jgi:adenosylmethionine-8-amino-7-oxononanoate aminotransferase
MDNVVVLAPPLCATEDDVDHIVRVLAEAFAEKTAPARAGP